MKIGDRVLYRNRKGTIIGIKDITDFWGPLYVSDMYNLAVEFDDGKIESGVPADSPYLYIIQDIT